MVWCHFPLARNQVRMRPVPVPRMVLLSPRMTWVGVVSGVNVSNHSQREDMVHEAPESMIQ